MREDFPGFVCPRCRGRLDEHDRGYLCDGCGIEYPVVAGIPDFRVFQDPWIGLEEDRRKARRFEERVAGVGLEEALRAYWSITPSTSPEDADRFVEHCLRARGRSEEWLDRVDETRAVASERYDRPWLDLGCGTGDLASAAASRGRRVVGVDIALRWLVVARRRPGVDVDGVRLVCACAEALPFPDARFGGVLSLGLLAHAAEPSAVAREARRVLVPGGRFDLRTVNRYTLLREPHVGAWGVGFVPRRWADAWVRLRGGDGYPHHRPLSPREVRLAMEGAGFREVRVEAAPTLEAEVERLSPAARRLRPVYEAVRRTPGVRGLLRWVTPLLEARGRRP